MKKMWKTRRNKEAVSPVIATILMVAITVVLAAVLYVMVMGFGGGQGNVGTASFTYQKNSSGNYTFTCTSVSKSDIKAADLTVIVAPQGTAYAPHYAGANLAAGDYFVVSGLSTANPSTITLKHTSGQAVYQVQFTAS